MIFGVKILHLHDCWCKKSCIDASFDDDNEDDNANNNDDDDIGDNDDDFVFKVYPLM